MRIFNEEQLLDEGFRKQVIEEINGPENQCRKAEMKKRYEVFKDNTKPYVLELLDAESSNKKAIAEAANRSANVSFTRDIVEKKSLVYKTPAKRTASKDQELVDMLVKKLNVNAKMKKTNKYTELFKNAAVSILPYYNPAEAGMFALRMNVYQPYLYDVIEDATNPEIARAYIFNNYNPSSQQNYKQPNEAGNREAPSSNYKHTKNDGIDQIIADSPEDKNNNEYIWWSNKYHFTTNEKGQIISGRQEESLENPIECLPIYNFSQDQDGQFWAKGGADIVDAGILLNLLLTDLFYIAKYQGQGIGYMFGRGVPKNMKVGPASFISVEMKEGDPTPQLGFATSNPPIEAHLSMVKNYLTYVLLTNNLSPDMAEASNTISGIHEMVKQSQNVSDIEDQQQVYVDGEPYLFKVAIKWLQLYNEHNLLDSSFKELGALKEDNEISIRFEDAKPFVTEKDKLDAIEKRIDLGIASQLDAIKADNPDLTEEEAQEKLRSIKEEKLKESRERMLQFGQQDKLQASSEDDSSEDEQEV